MGAAAEAVTEGASDVTDEEEEEVAKWGICGTKDVVDSRPVKVGTLVVMRLVVKLLTKEDTDTEDAGTETDSGADTFREGEEALVLFSGLGGGLAEFGSKSASTESLHFTRLDLVQVVWIFWWQEGQAIGFELDEKSLEH